MASKLNIFSVVLAVFLFIPQGLALEATNPSSEIFSPEPASDGFEPSIRGHGEIRDIPPEPEPYLDDCATKLGEACGEVIFASIFQQGEPTLECCKKLVAVGKRCNDDLVKWILELPEFKPNATQILSRSEHVWNDCSAFVWSISPTPSS